MTYRDDVPDGRFFARKTRTVTDGKTEVTLGFEWYGGAYIQVSRGHAFGNPQEVINVWDDAADQPTIPRTKAAMGRAIDTWIHSYSDEGAAALVHDVTVNWG